MDNKLVELELRLKELESKINKSDTIFGRTYSLVGTLESDFLIKTRGLVKVNWGSKTIDLIKDGKVNCDSKTIFSVKSKDNIGSKDGIYYTLSGEIWLKVSSDIIQLPSQTDDVFVSCNELELTDEQRLLVLINLGLVCNSSNIPQILNGFIYVYDEDLFYIVHNGIMSKLSIDFPNPLTVLLVIDLNGTGTGSLIILGSGKSNGINFGSSWLYEDSGVIIDSTSKIELKVNSLNGLVIYNYGIKTSSILTDLILSSNLLNGFRILEGVLYCDHVEERNPTNISSSDTSVYFHKALIVNCYDEEIEVMGTESILALELNTNPFKYGDLVIIPTNYMYEKEEEEFVTISYYIGEVVKNPDNEGTSSNVDTEMNSDKIYFKFIGMDLDILGFYLDDSDLKGKFIYLYLRGNLLALIIKNNSIYLGEDLIIGYDDNFKAQYPTNYDLPLNDNSPKFASTEWVNAIMAESLPVNTVIAFYGDTYPDGWVLCDGSNDTPNLTDLFRHTLGKPSLVYIMKV